MKIKKLIINNIASIEDATIDFEAEPLVSANVFLITGKIGSGKTTILDCICLALYGCTPRLPQKDKGHESTDDWDYGDTRRFVRRNAKGGSATVFFDADGQSYKAEWRVDTYIKGPKKGELNKKYWSVTNMTTGAVYTKIGEVRDCIERVTGLDFNQFCRTSMLAQGEFSRFLKCADQEKADILQKITGVDIYQRIGRAVNEQTLAVKHERDLITERLAMLTQLTDDERCRVINRLAAVNALATAWQHDLDETSEHSQWLKNQALAITKLNRATAEYNQAVAESISDDVVYSRRLLKVYEQTEQLRADINLLKTVETTINRCTKQAEVLRNKRQIIDAKRAQLGDGFTIEKSRQEHESLKDKLSAVSLANEKRKLADLAAAAFTENTRKIAEDQSKIEKTDALIEETKDKLLIIKGAVEALNVAKESLKDAAGDAASALRLKLNAGDRCPVCQNIVTALPHNEAIKREFDKANARYKAKYDEQIKTFNLQLKYGLERKNAVKDKEQREKQAGQLQAESIRALQELEIACKQADCTLETLDDEVAKLAELDTKIAQLKKAIAMGEEIEKDERRLQVDVATNDSALQSAENQKLSLSDSISQFRNENPDISDIEINDALAMNGPKINELRINLRNIEQAVSTRQGARQAATEALQANITLQPKSLEISDATDLSEIERVAANVDNTIIDLQRRKVALGHEAGRLQQQLAADKNIQSQRQALEARHEVIDRKFAVHQRLNNFIGDKDGKKFSRIALSYVLGTLIESANVYLHRFTERYTLSVQPGTYVIEVCDAWQNYTVRTVNTISGGESFLVSLSLALALSDIGGLQGAGTLFVDEGFGSLSGDELRRAVDALSTLHKVSGRQVGIISHISDLSERIPVQIRLDSAPNQTSTVSIQGGCV